MTQPAERLMQLFAGLTQAYGKYEVTGSRENGKAEGEARTVTDTTVTVELWQQHLSGAGLGIVPIRDDNTCVFGCIDIDEYQGFKHTPLIHKIKESRLPLLVCRSKSGGAHVFCFTSEPVPAKLMRTRLREWAAYLGHAKNHSGQETEIFPKQSKILVDHGDFGNWLNMPYCGGDDTNRYGFHPETTEKLALEDFLRISEERRVSLAMLKKFNPADQLADFPEAPPCFTPLVKHGVPDGARNNALFNFGVYAKKAFPDAWEDLVEEYNRKYMEPPLRSAEVQAVFKSLSRKQYTYKCSDAPINSFCDKKKCLQRKFGIGTGALLPSIGAMVHVDTDPAIYFMNVGDARVLFNPQDLLSPSAFRNRCLAVGILIPPVKSEVLFDTISRAFETKEVWNVPKELTVQGELKGLLQEFIQLRGATENKEEVRKGRILLEDGKYWVRLPDFKRFLSQQNYKDLAWRQVLAHLKDFGGEEKVKRLGKEETQRLFGVAVELPSLEPFELPVGLKEESPI